MNDNPVLVIGGGVCVIVIGLIAIRVVKFLSGWALLEEAFLAKSPVVKKRISESMTLQKGKGVTTLYQVHIEIRSGDLSIIPVLPLSLFHRNITVKMIDFEEEVTQEGTVQFRLNLPNRKLYFLFSFSDSRTNQIQKHQRNERDAVKLQRISVDS